MNVLYSIIGTKQVAGRRPTMQYTILAANDMEDTVDTNNVPDSGRVIVNKYAMLTFGSIYFFNREQDI
jgi:hypothetical protein